MPGGGLRVAPLWRRLAAGAIDTVLVVIPTAAGAMGGWRLWTLYRRWRGHHVTAMPTFPAGGPWGRAIEAVSQPLIAQTRNWRSPGYRALGLRRVDARTGGPVTFRSAVMRSVATRLWGQATRSLVRPWQTRQSERLKAIQAEVREVQRAHADDQGAANRAVMEIYKRERVNPVSSCVPSLIAATAPQLPAIWSSLNQTIPERLAGVVVVRDD
jgi:60Kd inner membrane protein/RDD family